MELLKLKILDTDGQTLMTAPGAAQVSLVYMNAYKPGDRVALEIGTPGQYVVIRFLSACFGQCGDPRRGCVCCPQRH